MKLINYYAILFSSIFTFNLVQAQESSNTDLLTKKINELDTKFWESYNTCNLVDFQKFLTSDLEFYHDKRGLTKGLDNLMNQIKSGLCDRSKRILRREAIEASIKVYDIRGYGALITGEHLFYLKQENEQERLVEKAKFSHLWIQENEKWKMSRIISYDHKATHKLNNEKAMIVSKQYLSKLSGNFNAPHSGVVKIINKGDHLMMKTDKRDFPIYPKSKTIFFIREAPITIEFIKSSNDSFNEFLVKENGKVVEKVKRME